MIYDCSLFFNEFDLLEIRLNTLDSLVDYFVIAEGKYTFLGERKPLHLKKALEEPRFKKFLPKIRYLCDSSEPGRETAINEAKQRNLLKEGLHDMSDSDLIFVSDADEVINPLAVMPYVDGLDGGLRIEPLHMVYWLNTRVHSIEGTCYFSFGRELKDVTLQEMWKKTRDNGMYLASGGWHWSRLGQKPNGPFGEWIVPLNVPEYMQKDVGRWRHLINSELKYRCAAQNLPKDRPLIGVEIGVHQGENSLALLSNLNIEKLYLIDPYFGEHTGWMYDHEFNANRRNIAHTLLEPFDDRVEWLEMTSDEAVTHVPDNLDFVYIDGDHSYEQVVPDVLNWHPKVRVGGQVSGHDYNDKGVGRAVRRVFGTDFSSSANAAADMTHDWWKVKNGGCIEVKPTILEQEVVMGVFTHRTDYLPTLMESVKKYLPHIQFIVKIASGGINENMEKLRQDFLKTNKRFWVFLDDDIQFLDSEIIHKAVTDLLANKFGLIGVYSTFDPGYKLGADNLECKEISWAPGYFMMVDSRYLSHITPDLSLPDPCTAIDTSYCVSVKASGFKIGISPSVVYHQKKEVWFDVEKGKLTDQYLYAKWGQFYYDNAGRIDNIVGEVCS